MDMGQERNLLQAGFERILGEYRQADGALPPMMELKRLHTFQVVENAVAVAAAEGWPDDWRFCGWAAALFHDVGRFPQLAQFGTFDDTKSTNHGEFGAGIAAGSGLFDGLPRDWREAILTAIRHHNARLLPPGLNSFPLALLRLVRDADRLDIYRVFEEAFVNGDIDKHPEITLGLPITYQPSAEAIARLRNRVQMRYSDLTNSADFDIIKLLWLYDFSYRGSLRLVLERGYLEKIGSRLPLEQPEMAAGFAELRKYVEEMVGKSEL